MVLSSKALKDVNYSLLIECCHRKRQYPLQRVVQMRVQIVQEESSNDLRLSGHKGTGGTPESDIS